MKDKRQLAEEYGERWLGSNIAWAAAQSGFLVGWDACLKSLLQTPVSSSLPIEFVAWLIGHDEDTVKQMYNDWSARQ